MIIKGQWTRVEKNNKAFDNHDACRRPPPFISFDAYMQQRVDVVKPWNQARVRSPDFEIRYLGKKQQRNRPGYIYSRIVMIHRRRLLLYAIFSSHISLYLYKQLDL